MRLRLDDRITCPREGCDAPAIVREGTRARGGRFGDWHIVCDAGHRSWERDRTYDPARRGSRRGAHGRGA